MARRAREKNVLNSKRGPLYEWSRRTLLSKPAKRREAKKRKKGMEERGKQSHSKLFPFPAPSELNRLLRPTSAEGKKEKGPDWERTNAREPRGCFPLSARKVHGTCQKGEGKKKGPS